jgi:hypothetical protein
MGSYDPGGLLLDAAYDPDAIQSTRSNARGDKRCLILLRPGIWVSDCKRVRQEAFSLGCGLWDKHLHRPSVRIV